MELIDFIIFAIKVDVLAIIGICALALLIIWGYNK